VALRQPIAATLRRLAGSLSSLAERIEAAPVRERKVEAPSIRKSEGRIGWDVWLFAAAIGVVLASRLVGLSDYPIYFFCDEAVQAVRASEFLRDGFRDQYHEFLPTYFQNGPFFNLSTSVYAQVLPVVLFGTTVFTTRAVAAVIAVSASIAVGLILGRIFALRFWWAGALLLGITPAWFLHSRTAFETSMATSFYAWFLYFYLGYRAGRPRALYPAVVFAALAFYTYSPMRLVVALTGVLLLLLDWTHHLRNRRTALRGLVLVLVLALPYARFVRSHPGSGERHMREIFSYWTDPNLTTRAKLANYGREYIAGLSPKYWYGPEPDRDLVRHRMKGYGHILGVTLPIFAAGLLVAAWRIRSAPYRVVLLALAVAPAGGALAATGITRALVFVIPAAILTSLGLDAIATFLARWIGLVPVAVALCLVLAAGQLAMLRDALVNGPTWYRDYGLGGMQYGGRQVFGEIQRLLERSPGLHVRVSPVWANGTDEIARFFMGNDRRVELQGLDWYTSEKRDIGSSSIAVLTAEEYARAVSDSRLVVSAAGPVIRYPDGTTGFHFVRLRYPKDIDTVMAAEREARHQLSSESVTLAGEQLEVSHSRLDMGPIGNLFDGDPRTLIRTDRVNPAIIDLRFRAPREVRSVTATTGSMELSLKVHLFRAGKGTEVREATFRKLPPDPSVRLAIVPPVRDVDRLRIEIRNLHATDADHIHVRELRID
jgi:4-amino-4-deoxy-L-arabinose transferase-like glycosyltransferase